MREDSEEWLAELERLRAVLITPLERLRAALSDCDGAEFAENMYGYLLALGVPERLEELAQSYEEIGEALSLEAGTVKSRIFRARKKLCSILSAEGNIPEAIASKHTKGGVKHG